MNQSSIESGIITALDQLLIKYQSMLAALGTKNEIPFPLLDLCSMYADDLYDLKINPLYKTQKLKWRRTLCELHQQFVLMFFNNNANVFRNVFDQRPFCLGMMNHADFLWLCILQLKMLKNYT